MVTVVASGCALSRGQAEARLSAALQEAVARDGLVAHGVLRVEAPHLGISTAWAVGDARPGQPLTPDTPFLSASVGKLVVAATVFDLAGDGVLSIDDPITRWVEPEVLAGLPVHGGPAGVEAVTVGMLLSHRSGLPDYLDTSVHPTRDGAPGIAQLMEDDPQRAWSRDLVMAYAAEHFDAVGPPGEVFLYSDLNDDLAGLVIEGATKKPWHAVVPERVLDPLQMTSTRVHLFEPPPGHVLPSALARLGATVLTGTPALGLDGAGGGLETTTGDLVRFIRGLERGESVSLGVLGAGRTADALHRGIDYGFGLWHIRPGGMLFLLGGLPELQGVSGATGSYVYLLEDGTVVAGTFDQLHYAEDHVRFLLAEVLPVLARVDGAPR